MNDNQAYDTERWSELVNAAKDFFAERPWELLLDDILFGVYDSLKGQILYCTVLGGLGEVLGLAVYSGVKGLNSYYELLSDDSMELDPRLYLDSKLISFEDRDDLTNQDYQLLKRLGFSFRGRKRWPQFRSYSPGYLEELPNVHERIEMITALQGATALMQLEKQAQVSWTGSQKIPVMHFNPDKSDWRLNYQEPESSSKNRTNASPPDEITMQRLKKNARKIGIWEGCLYPMPFVVDQEDGRSYFPYMGIWADHESGSILEYKFTDPDAAPQAFLDSLLSAIETTKIIPQTILIDQEECEDILNTVRDKLGLTIRQSVGLPALEEAMQSFQEQSQGNLEGFELEDSITSRQEEDNATYSYWIQDAIALNNDLLREFRDHLMDSCLNPETIENHLEITYIFINEYLLSDPENPFWYEQGIDSLDHFFQTWLPQKFDQLSVSRLKRMIAGLKKFYTFLFQYHYLDDQEFEEIKKSIRNNKENWIKGT